MTFEDSSWMRRSARIAQRQAEPGQRTETLVESSKAKARTWLESGIDEAPESQGASESSSESGADSGDDLKDFVCDDEDAELEQSTAEALLLLGKRHRVVMSDDRELVAASIRYQSLREICECLPPGSKLTDFPSREERRELAEMDGRLRLRAHLMAETASSHSWPPRILWMMRRRSCISSEPLVLGAKCQLCGAAEADGNANTVTLTWYDGGSDTLVVGAGCLKRAYICNLYFNFHSMIRNECLRFIGEHADPSASPAQLYRLVLERAALPDSLCDRLYVLWENLRKSDDAVFEQNNLRWSASCRPPPRFEE